MAKSLIIESLLYVHARRSSQATATPRCSPLQVHQTLTAWARRWPVFRFKLLHFNNVVITDPSELAPLVSRGPGELPRAVDLMYRPFNEVKGAAIHLFTASTDPKGSRWGRWDGGAVNGEVGWGSWDGRGANG